MTSKNRGLRKKEETEYIGITKRGLEELKRLKKKEEEKKKKK